MGPLSCCRSVFGVCLHAEAFPDYDQRDHRGRPPHDVKRGGPDRACKHEAERAGFEARRHAGGPRALVPVAPHIGDDSLVEAAEGVVPGVLPARPRERRVALSRS